MTMLRLITTMYARVRDAILRRWWQARGHLVLKALGVRGGKGTNFYGVPIISLEPGSEIVMGERISICSHPRYTALGVARPTIIRTLTKSASITIGSNVGMSGAVICAAVSVEIGPNCLIGADVQITDTDFHTIEAHNRRFEKSYSRIKSSPVQIGANVFLGSGVKVLKGVNIGENTVVGAGSIVTASIPPNSIAAGNPARVLRGKLPEGNALTSLHISSDTGIAASQDVKNG